MMYKYLVLFLLMSPLVFSACQGEAYGVVPAVVGDDGGLVSISVKLVNGKGDVYLTTYPNTGVSTQVSAEEAVFAGFNKAGMEISECDVLVRISGKDLASYVEGPSAGNAMAVLTYAAINNKPVREDSTITGAIDVSGNVLSVGGLFEKAKASAKLGFKYLITPVNRFAERIILKQIESQYGLKIIEVQNLDESVSFLIDQIEPPPKDFKALYQELPAIESYEDIEGLDQFKLVALNLITIENQTLAKIDGNDPDLNEVRNYFNNDIKRQLYLLEKGYIFSSANEAFLSYIDVSTILAAGNLDLQKKSDEISSCLSNLNPSKKTFANFEWLIGADLREGWARQRLQKVNVDQPQLTEEKYIYFNDLMFADAWCLVSRGLRDVAPLNGDQIDEAVWADLALQRIKQAELLNTTNPDWKERISNSKVLYANGKYGAAIYDATFATDMSSVDILSNSLNLTASVDSLANSKKASLWGKIYQTQGVYLYRQGDTVNAYRILTYASSLDSTTAEMQQLLKKDTNSITKKTFDLDGNGDLDLVSILLIALGAISIFIILVIVVLKFANLNSQNKNKKRYKI